MSECTQEVVCSEASRWRASFFVSVGSSISFQFVEVLIIVGWTAPMQKLIQSVFFGLFCVRCLCFLSAAM